LDTGIVSAGVIVIERKRQFTERIANIHAWVGGTIRKFGQRIRILDDHRLRFGNNPIGSCSGIIAFFRCRFSGAVRRLFDNDIGIRNILWFCKFSVCE